jgi:hypothetical protein
LLNNGNLLSLLLQLLYRLLLLFLLLLRLSHVPIVPVVLTIIPWPYLPCCDTVCLVASQITTSRPQEGLDRPRGVLSPTGLRHFRGPCTRRTPPSDVSKSYSETRIIQPLGIHCPIPLQNACFIGAWHHAIFALGVLFPRPPSPCPGHQA